MPRSKVKRTKRASRPNTVKAFEAAQSKLATERGAQCAKAASSSDTAKEDRATMVANFIRFIDEHCLAPVSLRGNAEKFRLQVTRNFELTKAAARDEAESLKAGNSAFRKASTKNLRQNLRPVLEQFCHYVFTVKDGFKLVREEIAEGSTFTQLSEFLYAPLDDICAGDNNTILYGFDPEKETWYSLNQEQQKLSPGTEFNLPVGGDGERTRKVVVTKSSSGAAYVAFRNQQILIKDLGSSGSKFVRKQREQLLPDVYQIPVESQ